MNKNAFLLKSIDELFQKGKDEVSNAALKGLMQKVFFYSTDILFPLMFRIQCLT